MNHKRCKTSFEAISIMSRPSLFYYNNRYRPSIGITPESDNCRLGLHFIAIRHMAFDKGFVQNINVFTLFVMLPC